MTTDDSTTTPAALPPVRVGADVRLVVRRKIIGPDWEFPVGMKLAGMKCGDDGRWRVWPHGQDYAFLVGVPRWYVKREKPHAEHEPRAVASRAPCSCSASGSEVD